MTTPACLSCHDTGSREGRSEFAGQVYTYCRCEAGRALKARDDARADWDRRPARTVTVRTDGRATR